MAEKFLIKVSGENFSFSMQGEGDLEAAKAEVAKAFPTLTVSGYGFGEAPDIETG